MCVNVYKRKEQIYLLEDKNCNETIIFFSCMTLSGTVNFDIDLYQKTSNCNNTDKFSLLALPFAANSGVHWVKIMRSLFPRTEKCKLTGAQILLTWQDNFLDLITEMGCDANGLLTCSTDLHPRAAEMEGVGEGGRV